MILGLSLPGIFAGCSSAPFFRQSVFVASYQPSNVYLEEASLASEIKRVAVLPLAVGVSSAEIEFGRDTLWPMLTGELGRSRQFEIVIVSPEQMQKMTGSRHWGSGERFPEDFFEKLAQKLGVQAVLLAELTQYRPHEPLVIGWRLKLVDATEPRIIWAVDEVFDARVPSVAAAACRYAQSHPDTASSMADDRSVLQSPRRFARYTASAVVSTLPSRGSTNPDLKF